MRESVPRQFFREQLHRLPLGVGIPKNGFALFAGQAFRLGQAGFAGAPREGGDGGDGEAEHAAEGAEQALGLGALGDEGGGFGGVEGVAEAGGVEVAVVAEFGGEPAFAGGEAEAGGFAVGLAVLGFFARFAGAVGGCRRGGGP